MLDICLFAGNRRMKIAQLLLKQGLITIQPTIHLRNEMKLKWELHSTLQMGLDLHNPILLLPYQMFQLVILIFRQNIFSHLCTYTQCEKLLQNAITILQKNQHFLCQTIAFTKKVTKELISRNILNVNTFYITFSHFTNY